MERRLVGGHHRRVLAELRLDPVEGRLERTRIHPAHETEGEEVLRALGVSLLHIEIGGRPDGQLRHGDFVHDVAVEGAIGPRIDLVPTLLEVPFVERVDVEDQGALWLQPIELALQCRRVHRHEHVGLVTRGVDVVVGDVHLEGRHTGLGSLGCPDLGREIRERGKVIAGKRARRGEAITRELHAVSGVAGESDDHVVECFHFDPIGGVGHSASCL